MQYPHREAMHKLGYKAKSEATSVIDDTGKHYHQILFFSDALSVLQAYHNTQALQQVAQGRRVVLQWIPDHCGVPGNEHADRLAKEGTGGEQPNNSIGYSEMRGIIRELSIPTLSKDDYSLMTRERQRVRPDGASHWAQYTKQTHTPKGVSPPVLSVKGVELFEVLML